MEYHIIIMNLATAQYIVPGATVDDSRARVAVAVLLPPVAQRGEGEVFDVLELVSHYISELYVVKQVRPEAGHLKRREE